MAFQTLLGGIKVFDEAHMDGWNKSGVITDGDYRGTIIPSDEDARAQYLGTHFSRVSVPAMTTMSFINVAVKPINDNGSSSPIVAELRPRDANRSYLYWNANSNYNLSELTIVPGNLDTDNRPDITNFFGWLKIIDDEDNGRVVGYQLCAYYMYSDGRSYNIISSSNNNILNVKALEDVYNSTAGPTTSDPDLGPESQPEGYGQDDPSNPPAFDHTSDTIPVPSDPTVGVTTAGFYHAYKVTQNGLSGLGAELFPTLGQIVGDLTGIDSELDALKVLMNLCISRGLFSTQQVAGQAISALDILMNGKLIDYVVSCHCIPVTPTVGGSQNIRCGVRELSIAAPVITSDYVTFDAGSLAIPSQYQNFLDVTQCRARLFLPFVGFVDLKPEYWHGGVVSVKYKFNIIDGSFMAYVSASSKFSNLSNSVIGQYGGSACLHIPVTGRDYASVVSGMVSGSMSLVAGAATGNMAGAIAGSALSVANMRAPMAQSNNYNCSTSFLGVRRPYLLIERAIPNVSSMYPHDNGFPLNVNFTLGSMSGYTEVEQIDLTGIGGTDEERTEILNLLRGGVYL